MACKLDECPGRLVWLSSYKNAAMYKIYKIQNNKVKLLLKPEKNCWIDIVSPTDLEIQELSRYVEISEEIIQSVNDLEEVPKVEEIDGWQFLLLQTPRGDEQVSHEFSVAPLGILFGGDYLVTISYGENEVLEYLRTKLKNIAKNSIVSTQRQPQMILKLMLFTSKIYLRYLKQINKKINIAQDKVEKSLKSKDIVNLMDLGKSLTYFSGYLQSNHLAYLKIARMSRFKSNDDDKELLEDVIDENLQAQETVKIYSQIVQSTISSYANLISNNLNENVKFLTSFTIILMMPTLVASVYGMNIVLPFQDHPWAFLIVTGLAVIFTVLLVVVFFRKKLF